MSESLPPNIDQAATQLLEQLETVRRSKADAPEGERKAAFERALSERLSGWPADTSRRVVGAVRERLIAGARARDARLAELEAEAAQLRGQLQALAADRDRLQAEIRELKAARPAQPAAAAAPAVSGEALQRMREGLLEVAKVIEAGKGTEPSPDSLGLPPAEARFFRLIRELLSFTFLSEKGVNQLIDEFNVREAGGLDSVQIKLQKRQVGERFQACLRNENGSVQALQKALDKMKGFLVDLNAAYAASLNAGTRSMLEKLDPLPIAEKYRKPIIGIDHGEAWKALGRIHGDLTGMSKNELWERFFSEPFRSKLSVHLGASGR